MTRAWQEELDNAHEEAARWRTRARDAETREAEWKRMCGEAVEVAETLRVQRDSEAEQANLITGALTDVDDRALAAEAREKERDERDDWLIRQLDGCIEDAEALPGQGPGSHLATALLRNLIDARAALVRGEEKGLEAGDGQDVVVVHPPSDEVLGIVSGRIIAEHGETLRKLGDE